MPRPGIKPTNFCCTGQHPRASFAFLGRFGDNKHWKRIVTPGFRCEHMTQVWPVREEHTWPRQWGTVRCGYITQDRPSALRFCSVSPRSHFLIPWAWSHLAIGWKLLVDIASYRGDPATRIRLRTKPQESGGALQNQEVVLMAAGGRCLLVNWNPAPLTWADVLHF